VTLDTAIGLAISHDQGVTFERIGAGPVLGPTLNEPFLVGDPFVLHHDGTYHMWYIFGTMWRRFATGAAADRTYKIGHATSANGIDWVSGGGRPIIPDRLSGDESQALPSVVFRDGLFHMVFCFRESFDFRKNAERGYRLGYAVSDDLRSWRRDDTLVPPAGSAGEWDSQMQCYPNLFECDGELCLLYNGNAFGRHGFGLAVLE
jgi:predicted GH43/DUF377 family glycosyl hydrolase